MSANESTVLAWHQSRRGSERLKEMVANSPLARLVGLEASGEEFERKAVAIKPDILLVEVGGGLNGAGDLLQRLKRNLPRASMVAVAETREPDQILSAMRVGVQEWLVEPVADNAFNDAVLRLSRQAQMAGKPAGRAISVMGVKGGVGVSSIALSLAWALSRQMGRRVALADLDLYNGDLAHMLDLKPERDVSDVAANFDRLDSVLMDSLLNEISPNLRFLAAPSDPVAAEEINAAQMERALDHLMDEHQVVVLDLPSRLDEVSLMALDHSHLVLLILEPTLVGLRGVRRFNDLAERLWPGSDKMRLVVNRMGAKGCLAKSDLQKALGTAPAAYLPNDTRTVMEAANAGRPALRDQPRAKWSKCIRKLAEEMSQTPTAQEMGAES